MGEITLVTDFFDIGRGQDKNEELRRSASKYFDEEFDGYRAHFHPTNLEKSMNDEYQKWD